MHIKVKFCVILSLIYALMTPMTAQALSWSDIKEAGSDIYQSAKAAAPGVLEKGKELAGVAAEKAGEAYEAAKEKAPEVAAKAQDALQSAGEKAGDFQASQQEQFWDWFDQQTGGSSTSGSSSSTNDAVTPRDDADGMIPDQQVNDTGEMVASEPAAGPDNPAADDQAVTPSDAIANGQIYYYGPAQADDVEETEDIAAPASEAEVRSMTPIELETGYYAVDDQLYYYDAETGKLSVATAVPATDSPMEEVKDADSENAEVERSRSWTSRAPWIFAIGPTMLLVILIIGAWQWNKNYQPDPTRRPRRHTRWP